MSDPTAPAPESRPRIVPLVLGLVLVAAVIAVALLVERATGSSVDLPDQLAGGFGTDPRSELDDSAEDRLEDVLGAPATVRSYRADDAEAQVTITVVEQAPGPFAPDGPQADPELLRLARGPDELVRVGEAVCQQSWSTVVAEGEDLPEEEPAAVHCQLGADGRTFWLNGGGLSVDDAVEILEDVAD